MGYLRYKRRVYRGGRVVRPQHLVVRRTFFDQTVSGPMLLALSVWAALALCVGVAIFDRSATTKKMRHFAAYPNCMSARAVGLAPARRGQPGYWPHLDRDRDGIACEPYPLKLRW